VTETLAALVVLTGTATIYAEPYVGQPLYCDRGEGLIYGPESPPWVAVDVGEYESGRVRCWDLLYIRFANGETLLAYALDAGYLASHYVEQWGTQPIVLDVPAPLAPFPGLSIPATALNLSTLRREYVSSRGSGLPAIQEE
jgi:hypothetical protein